METRSHIPLLFDSHPYYDDYSLSKGFLKSLFKPGYAVQARELTQLQSMLQGQIERFGSHVFKNGSIVLGGEIGESSAHYVRVSEDTSLSDISDLVGKDLLRVVYNAEGEEIKTDKLGKVIYVIDSTIKADGSGLEDNQIIVYQPLMVGDIAELDTLRVSDLGIVGNFTASGVGNAATNGTDAIQISVAEGVFYVDGYFVYSSGQTTIPYNTSDEGIRVFSNPTATVGFRVDKIIINATQDETLRDPAAGFYNFNAPGSDRFKIDLVMKFETFTALAGDASNLVFTSESFLELVRIVDGNTTKKVLYSDYSEIEEALARRTYDESGHYTVTTPKIRVVEHGTAFAPADPNKFAVGIEPHKSYVSGFEIDTQSTLFLSVDKARDIHRVISEPFDTILGNYFVVDKTTSLIGQNANSTDPDGIAVRLVRGDRYEIQASGQEALGYCNVLALRVANTGTPNAEYRLYVHNIEMLSGKNITNAIRLNPLDGVASPIQTLPIYIADTNNVGPHSPNIRSLLFPTASNGTISENGVVSGQAGTTQLTTQVHRTFQIDDGAPNHTFTSPYRVSGDGNPIVIRTLSAGADAKIDPNVTVLVDPDYHTHITVQFDPPITDGTYSILYDVILRPIDHGQADSQVRKKASAQIIDQRTSTTTKNINGKEYVQFTLSKADVIDVSRVVDIHGDEIQDIDQFVIIDNGQRQHSYNVGIVYVDSEFVTPVGDPDTWSVAVHYTYYDHSDFGPVTPESYTVNGVLYEDIPSFTDPDSGKFYRLQNYIDYRPVQTDDSNWGFASSHPYERGMATHMSPESGFLSYDSYLPRTDTVVVDGEDRSLKIVRGVPGVIDDTPNLSPNDMALYNIDISPYVFDLSKDIKTRFVSNNRFTMKQIGQLKNENDIRYRADRYNSLLSSALSLFNTWQFSSETSTPDQNAVLVDDLTGHGFADVVDRSHNCSMDSAIGAARPPITQKAHNVAHSAAVGGNPTISSDGIITFGLGTPITALKQIEGTGSVSTNSFGEVDYLGHMSLTPSSDFYFDSLAAPYVYVNSYGENNAYEVGLSAFQSGRSFGFGTIEREWEHLWLGEKSDFRSRNVIDPFSRSYSSPIINQNNRYPDRILRTVGERTVDESVTPYMRSVTINFSVTGMMPGAVVYAFFDGVMVGDSTGYTVAETDVADDIGTVSGSIDIPSGTFVSGVKSFRLIDRTDNNNELALTMAESKFYSQGVLNTTDNLITSFRPPISRRKSVNSPDIIDSNYQSLQDDNFSPVVGGLEPLAQEFVVDPGTYANGIFLESVDLFVKNADPNQPITIQIRPMELGRPHPHTVIPLSTVTKTTAVVSNGPNETLNTNFKFSSPIYLSSGKYAVCVISNGNYELWSATDGQTIIDIDGVPVSDGQKYNFNSGVGLKLGGIFNPISNGTRVKDSSHQLTMRINKHHFNSTQDKNLNITPIGSTNNVSAIILTGNDQPFGASSLNPTIKLGTTNLSLNKATNIPPKTVSPDETSIIMTFGAVNNRDLSPIIDSERLGIIAIRDEVSATTSDLVGELSSGSGSSTIPARYVSKRVDTNYSNMNDIAVFLKIYGGKTDGAVAVFVKTGSESNFDNNLYTQLYPQYVGDARAGIVTNKTKANTFNEYCFRPSPGLPEYDTYSVKIVMMADPENDSHNEMPYVMDLRAVPLRTT
jgi:hypothetical protein